MTDNLRRRRVADGIANFKGARRRIVRGLEPARNFFTGEDGMLNTAAELEDWALVDLVAEIEAATGIPAIVENIANAAAIGLVLGKLVRDPVAAGRAQFLGAGLASLGFVAFATTPMAAPDQKLATTLLSLLAFRFGYSIYGAGLPRHYGPFWRVSPRARPI